jgi:hypothetical protein
VPPPVAAFATTAVAALVPFGIAQAPDHVAAWKTIGSVLALILGGVALGTGRLRFRRRRPLASEV